MESWVYKRENCKSHQIKILSKDIAGMSKGSKMLIANTKIFDEFINKIPRGNFVEILKSKSKGQYSYSTTRPGVTRGDHFHMRKIERFSVIKGQSLIQLRKIGSEKIIEFKLSGEYPSFVDMPIWYTHNIKNIGKEDLITLFWINEAYDPNNPDTYIEKV